MNKCECSNGYRRDNRGLCVEQRTSSCPTGQVEVNGNCICVVGFIKVNDKCERQCG